MQQSMKAVHWKHRKRDKSVEVRFFDLGQFSGVAIWNRLSHGLSLGKDIHWKHRNVEGPISSN
jgi:hypothetical protein